MSGVSIGPTVSIGSTISWGGGVGWGGVSDNGGALVTNAILSEISDFFTTESGADYIVQEI